MSGHSEAQPPRSYPPRSRVGRRQVSRIRKESRRPRRTTAYAGLRSRRRLLSGKGYLRRGCHGVKLTRYEHRKGTALTYADCRAAGLITGSPVDIRARGTNNR